MCEWGNQVILALPEGIDPSKENRSISCDACIQGIITMLWHADWQTLGCCCGHGTRNPSIVIADSYTDDDIARLKRFIQSVDQRPWDIYQWRFTKVR